MYVLICWNSVRKIAQMQADTRLVLFLQKFFALNCPTYFSKLFVIIINKQEVKNNITLYINKNTSYKKV